MKIFHKLVFNLKTRIYFKIHNFSQYLFEFSIKKTQEILKDDRYIDFIKDMYIKGEERDTKLG